MVSGIDLSSNGDYVVTGLMDKTVCLWDTNTSQRQATVNVGETVSSLFCAQERPNTIVIGGSDHVFIVDPRNLSNGAVGRWEGGDYWSQIVEIDSNRFMHNFGQIIRNYDGEILRKWDVMGYGCCYVPPFRPRLITANATSPIVDGSLVQLDDESQPQEPGDGVYQIMEGLEVLVTIRRIPISGARARREGTWSNSPLVVESVRMLADIVHENVLRCYGCCYAEDGTHMNVLLEKFGGNLAEWLERHFVGRLTKLRKVYFLLEIARGLLHLHERGLIIPDLSLDTVAVSSMDFDEAVTKLLPLSIHRLSDEDEDDDLDLGEDPIEFEIYSFGVLCWEIWMGKRGPTRCRRGVPRASPKIAMCVGMPASLQELVAACFADVSHEPLSATIQFGGAYFDQPRIVMVGDRRLPLREVVNVLGDIYTRLLTERNASSLKNVVVRKRPGDDLVFLRVLDDLLDGTFVFVPTEAIVFTDQLVQLSRFLENQQQLCSFLRRLLPSRFPDDLKELLEHDLGPPSRLCFVGSLGVGKSSCINALMDISCCPIVRGSVTVLCDVRFGKERSAVLMLGKGEQPPARRSLALGVTLDGDLCFDSENHLRPEEFTEKKLTEVQRIQKFEKSGCVVIWLPAPLFVSLRPIDTPAFGEFDLTDELICERCVFSLVVFVIRATNLLYRTRQGFTLSHNDTRILLKLRGELESTIPSVELASRFLFLITFVDQLPEVHRMAIEEVEVEADVLNCLKQDELFPSLRRDQVVAFCPLQSKEDPAHLLRAQTAISQALFRRSREILRQIQQKGDPFFRDNLRNSAASALRSLSLETLPAVDEDFLVRKTMTILDSHICQSLSWPPEEAVRKHRKRLQLLAPSEVVGPEEFQVSIPGLRYRTVYSRDENRRSRLAGGRFGIVFRAVQWEEGEEGGVLDVVAMKRIPTRDAGGASWSSETIEGFRREMEISLRLHHPNVVETYEIGADSDYWYIVMELCEGGSLRSLLTKNVDEDGIQMGIPEDRACRFLLDAAAGLHYLHSFDPPLIHRDVNPANFLLDADGGSLKICDFGTARYVKQKALTMTSGRGTFEYMAPELIKALRRKLAKIRYTNKVDIYSLGVVFYEMLTGMADQSLRARYSGELFDFCDRLLLKNPEDRPSAEEILRNPLIRSTAAPSLRTAFRDRFLKGLGDVASSATLSRKEEEEEAEGEAVA